MARYNLFVKVQGAWERLCSIDATGHRDAFKQAAASLKPEHSAKPIKLEQEEEASAHTPFDMTRDPPDGSRGGR